MFNYNENGDIIDWNGIVAGHITIPQGESEYDIADEEYRDMLADGFRAILNKIKEHDEQAI